MDVAAVQLSEQQQQQQRFLSTDMRILLVVGSGGKEEGKGEASVTERQHTHTEGLIEMLARSGYQVSVEGTAAAWEHFVTHAHASTVAAAGGRAGQTSEKKRAGGGETGSASSDGMHAQHTQHLSPGCLEFIRAVRSQTQPH